MNWSDLRYLGIVGRKGRIPSWFNFIKNNFLSSVDSSLFLTSYFINSSFTIASLCLLDDTIKDYHFYPQWAVNFNSATQTLSVGRVCITYRKQDSVIMSHWLPVSTSADERSYNPCPGCSFNIPTLSKKSAIKQCCNSEKCFFNVILSETVGYPTRNTKVFAAYLPITLSTLWSYATSLALVRLTNPPLSASSALSSSFMARIEDDVLPLSVQSLYTDGSFHPAKDSSPSSMTSAWLALDDDRLILESSSLHLPSCFPSALHSEIYAVVLRLNALSRSSSISIYTDCSQLILLWTRFVDAPFSLKLLREPNHLLWLSIRHLILDHNLKIDLIKVPAHGDDIYNIQADSLAKDAHSSLQPAVSPLADSCLSAFLSLKSLDVAFQTGFSALDCWNYDTPSLSCLWLIRGLLPAHLTIFLKQYFPLSVIYKTISPLLNDFQVELYGEIWLCRNVLFHAWEKSQGISAASKLRGPPSYFSFTTISPQNNNSSLATVSQDSWISWISSSIIRDGSWISHLDFLRRLTVQPLRISFR
ncbi:hypothetical protein GLOIN_2v1785823 [Rhizophagus irregularis DAOM 181602=DAOM 197198]|uniref:RNase H type-1 domain-containing protein n=1 Tax=Rhizophagus irregularis (strain DAOM 197198w) TaxID=1432141 RepID=A0A015IFF2_RHIIW|nr:hypothetical protein RirG_250820 [Rhizophagus irregularis DAOM 197198w]GET55852.1 hypothetical protein GLOIN_2v1785823 [Rhizophagus irregularis DAOM 181602=DAOM 197198]